jgi:energy-coupling factor transporter ATP-binding protein EcfA2
MKPLTIEPLMDLEVQNLSGGELQRVALALCLGQPADIYLIDEPSAYLDSEQRIMASKVGGGANQGVGVSHRQPQWYRQKLGGPSRRGFSGFWKGGSSEV